MASIVKRKNKFAVVYTCEDENGVKRQKWETYPTNAEAKKRKAEIEYQQNQGTFIVPSSKTVRDLMSDYVSLYGTNTWALSTFESNRSIINNYILPILGDLKLDDISPRLMDGYYRDLLKVKAKSSKYYKPRSEFVTPTQIREIHKLLHNAFNQAVKWELMARNPVSNATLPKVEEKKRDIWDAETLFHAIDVCDDPILKLALNLAFSCSLRMGEMLGLTWDCVDISQTSIDNGNAHIYINKELQRVTNDAYDKLNGKDVSFTFPAQLQSYSTKLVLKCPKTRTSIRKVFLPKTVAEMLIAHREVQEQDKELLGEEYRDYGLVFCYPNGAPLEGSKINTKLAALIKEHDLPKVVFHSIRHSSTTYKLKLTNGDIKAVQGDTGHAQASMVTERYAHILDEDRKLNAQKFEEAFYSGTQLKPDAEEKKASPESKEALLASLLTDPKMVELLKSLASTL